MVINDVGEVSVLQPSHRAEAVGFKEPIHGVCGRFRLCDLARNDVAVPDKRDGGVLAALGNPPPERVIGVVPCVAVRASGAGHLVMRVPAKRPRLWSEPVAGNCALGHAAADVVFERHNLAQRTARKLHNTGRCRLPVLELVGVARARDVQVGGVGEPFDFAGLSKHRYTASFNLLTRFTSYVTPHSLKRRMCCSV